VVPPITGAAVAKHIATHNNTPKAQFFLRFGGVVFAFCKGVPLSAAQALFSPW